jgi:hypothetical protein
MILARVHELRCFHKPAAIYKLLLYIKTAGISRAHGWVGPTIEAITEPKFTALQKHQLVQMDILVRCEEMIDI